MGDILRGRDLPDAAEAEWNEARRLHPEHPQANLRLAQLYLSRGQVARAMVTLELSLLSSPGSQERARLRAGRDGAARSRAARGVAEAGAVRRARSPPCATARR